MAIASSRKAPTMADRKNPPTPLAPAEWEVMKLLWDHGPLAARDVYARLPEHRGWAYKTAKTLLSRLVAKEAVAYDQIGNSYLYRTAVDRDEMTRHEVRGVFQRLISEACSPVLAQFIEEADLSDAEIRQLKRQLDDKRKKPPHREEPRS
jgi:BlaI family transcriptional regulator, penicillinase repressor